MKRVEEYNQTLERRSMEKGSNHYSNPTFLTMLALENNNNKLAKRTLQLDKEE